MGARLFFRPCFTWIVFPMHHINAGGATQDVQSDFWRTIETNRHNAGPNTYRGIAMHILILPSARPHAPRHYCMELDGNSSRQANLSTVGVPAEQQLEA